MEPISLRQALITLEKVILFFVSFALSEAAVTALIQRWPYRAINQVVYVEMSAQSITEDRAVVWVS